MEVLKAEKRREGKECQRFYYEILSARSRLHHIISYAYFLPMILRDELADSHTIFCNPKKSLRYVSMLSLITAYSFLSDLSKYIPMGDRGEKQ